MFKLRLLFLVIINVQFAFSQTDILSIEKLKQDLSIFKQIREQANSGLYKYKTKTQIDSIYVWAEKKIQQPLNTIEFYKIICQLTDFEGSTHNETFLSNEIANAFGATDGYFPLPIKLLNEQLLVNIKNSEIPLASEIHSINGIATSEILKNIHKYYTTDGTNISGKSSGINESFARFLKYEYGVFDNFEIKYSEPFSTDILTKSIKSVSKKIKNDNFFNRHSKKIDSLNYHSFKNDEKYKFDLKSKKIAILTVNTFNIGGNEHTREHKIYKKNLQKWFKKLDENKVENLIIDLRYNGGGTDPNDILLFSFLANKPFRENKSAFITTTKIPFPEYLVTDNHKISKREQKYFEKYLNKEFSVFKDGKYFQNETFNKYIEPNENAFKGQIYLLISERVASAGSQFASLVASNTTAIIIGNETMGGYFGHNGHTPVEYELPNSKIITQFSIVNLKQDVTERKNQIFGRGVIPDIYKSQTLKEYIDNEDNIIDFTIKLIEEKN